MIALRALLSVLLLPGVVTVLLPWTLVSWFGTPQTSGESVLPIVAAALLAVGLVFAAWTIALFAHTGRGTLAPWDPPRRLVVRGPYRRVRNPMIFAVSLVLLGEALWFRSLPIGVLWAVFVLANRIWIPLVEEPGLRKRFGDPYLAFTQSVPRWLPQRRAWSDGDAAAGRVFPSDQLVPPFPVAERLRGPVVFACAQTVFVAATGGVLLALLSPALALPWALPLLFAAWAALDLADAWCDGFRPFPDAEAQVRALPDDAALEFKRGAGGPEDLAAVKVVPVKGASAQHRRTIVLRRRTLVSRPIARALRRGCPRLRVALRLEPRGRPDADDFVRYVATAAYDDPPGAWAALDPAD